MDFNGIDWIINVIGTWSFLPDENLNITTIVLFIINQQFLIPYSICESKEKLNDKRILKNSMWYVTSQLYNVFFLKI